MGAFAKLAEIRLVARPRRRPAGAAVILFLFESTQVHAGETLARPMKRAAAFLAFVPPRKSRPAHVPSNWERLSAMLTPFDGRPGVEVCLAQDLLNQLRRDIKHVKQDVTKWRVLVPMCNLARECFQLEDYIGISGNPPWVVTLPCAKQVYLKVYNGIALHGNKWQQDIDDRQSWHHFAGPLV